MSDSDIERLAEALNSGDSKAAALALDELAKLKGRSASKTLAEYLMVAPTGLLATRAAMALEKRAHKSTLPILYKAFEARPELSEDIIPIFSAMEDFDAVALVVPRLRDLMRSPARLSALAYLVKCADGEGLAELILPLMFLDPIPAAQDDLSWALEHVLDQADEAALKSIGATAKAIGPGAWELVEPFMPAQSELEREAPNIARRLLTHMEEKELIELVPDSQDALVEVLASTICEARSPKGLVKDVERILLNSPSTEELYADRNDIRTAFETITRG